MLLFRRNVCVTVSVYSIALLVVSLDASSGPAPSLWGQLLTSRGSHSVFEGHGSHGNKALGFFSFCLFFLVCFFGCLTSSDNH